MCSHAAWGHATSSSAPALVVAVAHDRDPATWLAGSVLADAADATATLAAGDNIPRLGRLGTTALAGGSALFGAWLARAID